MSNNQGRCSQCGNLNIYTKVLCDFCGTRLPWADAVQSSAPAPIQSAQYLPPPIPSVTSNPQTQSAYINVDAAPSPIGCLPLFGAAILALASALTVGAIAGDGIVSLIIIATIIWVGVDASSIGVKRGQLRGLGDSSVSTWVCACILLWFVAFPAYLMARPELKRINGKS